MKRILISGSLAGLIIVMGEGVLNGAILADEWKAMNGVLGLGEPSQIVMALALGKLFILGFIVAWLNQVFLSKYKSEVKAGLYAGLTVGILIWCWALSGLLMAGYINTTIALITFPWGLIELCLAGLVSGKMFEKLSAA